MSTQKTTASPNMEPHKYEIYVSISYYSDAKRRDNFHQGIQGRKCAHARSQSTETQG
jgi:hypothetical protein